MGSANDLGALLRDADPLAREGGLSAEHAASIRRAALAAAGQRPPTMASWPGPIFVAATVAATLAAGVALGRWLPAPGATVFDSSVAPSSSSSVASNARRQLQFATPGGTRIIWVFDPEFNP